MKVCVIGAGISGLAVALALAVKGAEVTVLEQAEEIREVGAGLQISPNGVRVLEALGLRGALEKNAVQGQAVSLRNYSDAREVVRLDLEQSRHGKDYFFVHRADLIELLANGAREAGVKIRLLQKVIEADCSKNPYVKTSCGNTIHADVVIGADGLHSVLRKTILGVTAPYFTHQTAWRAVVPNDLHLPPEARVYMGPKRHLVCYPLRSGELTNIVAVQERRDWVDEGWFHKDDPKNLIAAFADFGHEVHSLLERVTDVSYWGLFKHPVASSWHKGHTALLGDAAHPTLPFMAQGAVMGLEDAWVLADELGSGKPIGTALQDYQNRRKDRATKVIDTASGNAWKYHLSFGPTRWAAHLGLGVLGAIAPRRLLNQFDWIYGYDVTKADQAASSTQTGT